MNNSAIITRTRLTSITEEQAENERHQRTSVALIKLYHSMLCLNYTKVTGGSPKTRFQDISREINDRIPFDKSVYRQYDPSQEERTHTRNINYLSNKYKPKVVQNNKFISKDQFKKMMSERGGKLPLKTDKVPPLIQEPFMADNELVQDKDLQRTCAKSLSEIMTRLDEFEEQRSAIKSIIYLQSEKNYGMYQKWAKLHSSTKEILEAYLSKISQGRGIVSMFESLTPNKETNIEIQGYKIDWLFNKLDRYLNSLYMDERELMLQNEKIKWNLEKLGRLNDEERSEIFDNELGDELFQYVQNGKMTRSAENSRIITRKIEF